MRVPPNEVRRTTTPSGSAWISPISVAAAPSGCARSAASAASASSAGHHGEQLALVGHVQGVDAEQVARAVHGGVDRQLGPRRARRPGRVSWASSLQTVPTPPRVGSRSQRRFGAAAKQQLDELVERCGIRGDVGFQREVAAGEHHRHPVIGDAPRHDDPVTRGHRDRCQRAPRRHDAHAGGRHVEAVGGAAVHDLGVAGDDGDAAARRRLRHVGDDRPQLVDREPLLEDERGRDPGRAGPHHREVVDGAVDREVSDGSPGEAQGLHHERVGAERDTLPDGSPSTAASPSAVGSVSANASTNTASIRAADALPPAPWASVMTSSSKRGRRRRKASMRSRTAASSRVDGHRCRSWSDQSLDAIPQLEAHHGLRLLDPVHAVGADDEAVVDVGAGRERDHPRTRPVRS